MIIYAVDDELAPLELLGETLREVEPHAAIELFQQPMKFLAQAEDKPCDVAFLDIQMPGVDGLQLARKIREMGLAKNIVFVTSYSEYAVEAYDLFASGYLMKPATAEDVRRQLSNLRVPVVTEKTRIQVRTFGGFLVTVDGKPLKFKRSKSQEVLAFLVDKHGKTTTMEELAAAMWEGEPVTEDRLNYMRVLVSRMRKDLEAAGADDMLTWVGALPVANLDAFWCDAYELENGDPMVRHQYKGEYMTQYWWSEETAARLYYLVNE